MSVPPKIIEWQEGDGSMESPDKLFRHGNLCADVCEHGGEWLTWVARGKASWTCTKHATRAAARRAAETATGDRAKDGLVSLYLDEQIALASAVAALGRMAGGWRTLGRKGSISQQLAEDLAKRSERDAIVLSGLLSRFGSEA